jgi:hypothetical protein
VEVLSVNIGKPQPNPFKGSSATGIDKFLPMARCSRCLSRPGHDVTISLVFRALTLEPEPLPLILAADALPAECRDTALRRTSSGV